MPASSELKLGPIMTNAIYNLCLGVHLSSHNSLKYNSKFLTLANLNPNPDINFYPAATHIYANDSKLRWCRRLANLIRGLMTAVQADETIISA